MNEIRMQEMTWRDVAAAIARGADTVIIAVAAQEQHGPHLPLATDVYWGTEFAMRVARELGGRALVAPTVPFGPNEEMMGFPGTVSLTKGTLLAVLREVCSSYARHGFRNAVLLTSHEGDFEALDEAGRTFGDVGLQVIALGDIAAVARTIYTAAVRAGVDPGAAGAHSGEFETSLMLAAYPEKVRMEKAEQGAIVNLAEQPDFFRQDLSKVTPNGIIGDARQATPEQGERYWRALTALAVDYVKSRWNN